MEENDIVIVYFDFTINGVKAGRVVMELNPQLAPLAVENFRCLCTGEKGQGKQKKPLHFKGSRIHKVLPMCMVQGGDIINGDGTGGETIYGSCFDREINHLTHKEAGLVGLICDPVRQKNSSQFYITTDTCPHLDGENTIIGKVVKGFSTILDMSNYPKVNDVPLVNIEIANCGEFKLNEPWSMEEMDGTPDVYPSWPEDWNIEKITNETVMEALKNINQSGNIFFHNRNYLDAERKYKKVLRYIEWYRVKTNATNDVFTDIKYKALLNISAARLKCNKNAEAIESCEEVLKAKPNSGKAYYRRACAKLAMKEYDQALDDLKSAYKLHPNDQVIRNTFELVKKKKQAYLEKEKAFFEKIFNNF